LKWKDREYIYIIPFIILALYLRFRFYFFLKSSGTTLSQSLDSQWYLDYAYSLMTTWKIGHSMDDIMYIGYNLLLTLLLAIVKTPDAVIVIQIIVGACSVLFVYEIARILFNRLTAMIASYIYAYSWNTYVWSMYILTDSFFISLLLFNVFLLVKFMETKAKGYRILFIITTLYLLVFRPTGIVAIAFILVYVMLQLPKGLIVDWVKRHKKVLLSSFAVLAVGSVTLLLSGKLDTLIASMQFNAKKVLYNIYARGWIYDKPSSFDYFYRPNYDINILNSLIVSFLVNNADHILILYGRRMIAFLGMWVYKVNLTTLYGIKWFFKEAIPTGLFLFGTAAALFSKQFRRMSIVWLVFAAVFVFCIIFFIDGMYRYKAPSLPFIAIIAAYGAERVLYCAYAITKLVVKRCYLLYKSKFGGTRSA
jgi:4-amino-4-deoxy-L-arabinose transferase-like glycosyltransferase